MTEKVSIKDLEVKDIIHDMAHILGIDVQEENNETCFEIPEELGSGYVKAITFENGLGVIEADYLLKKDVTFYLDNSLVQPLKVIFNRESAFSHKFKGLDNIHSIEHLESAILSCNGKHGHVFKMPANQPICIFSLEINRKLFEQKISDFLSEMNEDLEELFRDVNGINLFYYKGHYSLDIAKFMEEFTECDLEGFMRYVYLEGKSYEILTHHFQQYLDDLNKPDRRKILRQSTVNRIEEAANIIKEEIDMIGNIPALAKRVGLNQNTLQNGFKYLYKTSVNEFIRDFRIQKAKELIESTDLNITEITYKIGINSRSYFSKLFKEKYGLTPTKYMEKSRKGFSEANSA